MAHGSSNTTNASFRMYDDDVAGAITAQTALAAADTNVTINTDTTFHAVLRWNETGGANAAVAARMEYNLAGGGWNDITGSTPVQTTTATNCTTSNGTEYATNAAGLADGTTVEKGTYNNNAADLASNTLNNSSDEVAYCLTIDSAQVSDAQTLQLRISDAGTALNADTTIITITINEPVSYTLTADGGTYNHTGTAADITAQRKMAAGAGSFTLTGTAATLAYGRVMPADAGSFTLTGTAADLRVGRKIAAETGALTLTGADATLRTARSMVAGGGAYSLTGTAATFPLGFSIIADAGSYTLTGTAATVKADRNLSAESGSLALTGTAATLAYGRVMPADAGSYTLSGTAATFPLGYSLSAEAGTLNFTGAAATLTADRTLAADPATFSLAGTAATLTVDRSIVAGAGSFSLAGTAASVTVDRTLTAAAGSYALSGTDATLTYTPSAPTLTAESGSYTLSGTDATLTYTPAAASLNAEPGAYTLTGTAAAFKVDRVLRASSDSVPSGSQVFDFKFDDQIYFVDGAEIYRIEGTTSRLARGLRLNAEAGVYTFTGARGKIYYTPIGTQVLAEESYFPSPALRSSSEDERVAQSAGATRTDDADVAASDRASYIEVRNKDSEAA